jgi:plasmid stabilization system protein ParE
VAYLVNISARAARDLAQLYEEINAESSDASLKWFRGLKKAILSLEEYPYRCPVTPENPKLRHLLYGHKPRVYRTIYKVTEKGKQVKILHIRHGARRRFKASEVS